MNWRDVFWPGVDYEMPSLKGAGDPRTVLVESDLWPDALKLLATEFKEEQDRSKAVEAKLNALGAIIPTSIGVLVALGTWMVTGMARHDLPANNLRTICAFGVLYVCVMFLRAFLAVLSGVARRGFQVPTAEQLQPETGESAQSYSRRQFAEYSECLASHRQQNDSKVTALAVAHVAARNAVIAGVVLAALSAVVAVFRGIH